MGAGEMECGIRLDFLFLNCKAIMMFTELGGSTDRGAGGLKITPGEHCGL